MTRVAVTTLTIGGSRKVDGMAAWVREGARRLNEDSDQFPAQRRPRGRGTLQSRIRCRQRHSASQAGPVQASSRAAGPLKPDTALLQETIRRAQQGDAA